MKVTVTVISKNVSAITQEFKNSYTDFVFTPSWLYSHVFECPNESGLLDSFA